MGHEDHVTSATIRRLLDRNVSQDYKVPTSLLLDYLVGNGDGVISLPV